MNEVTVLSGLVGGALALALASYADRKAAKRVDGAWVMHFSLPARAVAVVLSFGALTVLAILLTRSENRTTVALKNGLSAFAIVLVPGFWFLIQSLRSRVLITKEGLSDGRETITWSQVKFVDDNPFLGRYVVKAETGQRIKISHLMIGQAEFARSVIENVQKGRIKCWESLRAKSG